MSDWVLEIVEGDRAGTKLDLAHSLELGRDHDLPHPLDDDHVSRRHAQLEVADGGVYVEDLGSYNGTYVNEQPISGRVELSPGDRLRLGLTVFALAERGRGTAALSSAPAGPAVTKLGAGVLSPASESELAPDLGEGQAPPGVRIEEAEPAFIRVSAVREALKRPSRRDRGAGNSDAGASAAEGADADALARLVDTRVKRQTSIAAFALLAAAALAVVIVLGVI